LGGRDGADQGRFPGIGQTDQSHIGKQFQLQLELDDAAGFAGLERPRRPVGGGLVASVSHSAFATLCGHKSISGANQVRQQAPGFGFQDQRAGGNFDDKIFAFFAGLLFSLTVTAVFGLEVSFEMEIV
jgi:hypothetical protein